MKIIFCHHAQREKQNPSTQEDGLTVLGIEDAKITSQFFKKLKNVKAIYSSKFFRCKETARIVNEHIGAPIIEDERLNEYQSVPNETWKDLLTRVIDCFNDIYNKYDNDDIIICVTSGVNLSAFICWNFGLEPSSDIPFLSIPSCSPIGFSKDK